MSSESSAPAAAEPWTVRRILTWTTEHFTERGCDTPRLDVEILLAHVLNCPRIQLYVQYERQLTEAERTRLRGFVRRRADHEPVAYLVGKREFFGLDFRVTADVLIPRPDTETLVLALLDYLKDSPAAELIELGVGSGAISVAAAVHQSGLSISAVDICPQALQIAKQNAQRHKLESRINFYEGDLFASLPAGLRVDAVVSNPPYVQTAELDQLDADVKDHEPRLALDGGADGLDLARRIINDAPRFLKPNGLLLLELGPDNIQSAATFLKSQAGYQQIHILKDAAGRERVLSARCA
ncbi:MAG: peptide chain release factor N(5)-glutamine methyltransferase [Planctomycetaceae bacterium]|nr:peptide chain release factor N(5)-glutamine methyltransferase [Planctomycetaceae bacterium]